LRAARANRRATAATGRGDRPAQRRAGAGCPRRTVDRGPRRGRARRPRAGRAGDPALEPARLRDVPAVSRLRRRAHLSPLRHRAHGAPDAGRTTAVHSGAEFAAAELPRRSPPNPAYPPHVGLARFVASHEDAGRVQRTAERVAEWLVRANAERLSGALSVLGPAPCPIERL